MVASISATDDAILRAVGAYSYLTVAQLSRLIPKSERFRQNAPPPDGADTTRYLRERCLKLVTGEFLRRRYLPHALPGGKPPAIYWLATKGTQYLESLDVPFIDPPRPSDVETLSYQHLLHALSANDILIGAELLTRSHPDIWIAKMLPHRALNRQPVAVTLPDGTKTSTKPDGWVQFRFGDAETTDHQCIAFELDNGTEYQVAWKTKLARLVAYAAGPYQQWAGTSSLVIAVVATPGSTREDQLSAWTAAYLRETKAPAYYFDLFRFAGVHPARVSPDELYLSPLWHRPGDARREALIESDEGGV